MLKRSFSLLLFSLAFLAFLTALKAQQLPSAPSAPSAPSSSTAPNELPTLNPNDFRVTLRPLKESFSIEEPVVMEVRLVNRSPANRNFRFLLFNSPYQQFVFQLVTQAGTSSLKTITYLSKEAELLSIPTPPPTPLSKLPPAAEAREIELAPGQAFSWRLTVNDFFELTESGRYFIQGVFFPLSRSVADYSLPLEASSFYRQPPTPVRSSASAAASVEALAAPPNLPAKEERLGTVREPSPEGTVRSLLNYRKNQDWPAFLSQFHLESLLSATFRSTEYFERYQAALPQEKPIVMEEFKTFLVESQLSPGYLIVEQLLYDTQIQQTEAQSAVLLKIRFPVEMQEKKFNPLTLQEDSFWKPDFTTLVEGYRVFTYSLSRLKGDWKIMHYEVRVITEREALFIKERLAPAFASRTSPTAPPTTTETVTQPQTVPPVPPAATFFPVVFFPFDEAQPLPGQEETLQAAALFLLENDSFRVRLLGYTDDSGSRPYNLTLSKNRAQAVKDYLVAAGIEAARISSYGLGEASSPFETSLGEGDGETASEAQRQRQRRVEVYFFSAAAN